VVVIGIACPVRDSDGYSPAAIARPAVVLSARVRCRTAAPVRWS